MIVMLRLVDSKETKTKFLITTEHCADGVAVPHKHSLEAEFSWSEGEWRMCMSGGSCMTEVEAAEVARLLKKLNEERKQ